jgi:hypothetical protein
VDDSNSVRLDKFPHLVMRGWEVLLMVWEDEAAGVRTRRNTIAKTKYAVSKSGFYLILPSLHD